MDKFTQLRNKYLSSFKQKGRDIQKALNESDMEQLHGLLHKLTGSSGSYGFNKLSLLSKKATLLTKDFDELDRINVESATKDVIDELESESKNLQ